LARPVEGRGQPRSGVVNNTAPDVPGPMTRSSGECSACPLLLEVLSELHKSPHFFIELGLHRGVARAVCPDPPQGPGPQLAPAGSQRETQVQGRHCFLACRGCLRRDLPDRCGNTRELGRNPRRQGCGHRQSSRRGSGHMRI
jgi:hypothetical protein